MEAEVRRDHGPAGGEGEEVTQLAGAAANIEHPRPRRDLLVEEAGEDPLPGLLLEAGARVEILVVGKGVVLVELLDALRDVGLRVPFVRPEEQGNAAVTAEALAAARAQDRRLVLAHAERAGTARAGEELGLPEQERRHVRNRGHLTT